MTYYARADEPAYQPRIFREGDIADVRTGPVLCQTAQSNNSTALVVPDDKPLNPNERRVVIQDNYYKNRININLSILQMKTI